MSTAIFDWSIFRMVYRLV